MAENIEMSANNNTNCNIFQFNINGLEDNTQLLECMKALNMQGTNFFQIKSDLTNKKIEKLYNEFAKIVNDFDSLYYISKKDLEILNKCLTKMQVFEEDFENKSQEGEIFYNNLFALLLRIDKNLFISKYENSPDYVKKIDNNKYLYSVALYEIGNKTEAYNQIRELIDDTNDEKYFIQMCFFLFNDNNLKELKQLLGKNKKIDKYGYYGVFELYIKLSEEKSLKKLKKLNRKYKGKVLYHLYFAKIIYDNENRNLIELKENLKQAYLSIEENDLVMYLELINLSFYVKQQEYVYELLSGIKFTSTIINSRLLDILVYKQDKNENDIENIKQLLELVKDSEIININNANAIISMSLHKELEAIDYFVKSFNNNKNRYTAANLLNLILKNNDQRNFDKIDDCISVLGSSEYASDYMLIASSYLLKGNNDAALENAYIGAVLSQNNSDYFMRLWAINTMCENRIRKANSVDDDCVIILKRKEETIQIALDSQIIKYDKINSFQGIKFNKDKIFEINIKGKNIGDNVFYKDKEYRLDDIINKYDFFLKKIFPLINNGNYFKTIESVEGEDPLKGIKDLLIENKKDNEKKFEMYDLETSEYSGLPLSFFVNNEDRTYQNIMIHLLYYSKKSKLYSGEINDIDICQNMIIDITSLVLLNQFEYLDKLVEYKEYIYITQSTINTISKTFNYYLKNRKESLSVFVNDDNELCKQELSEDDNKKILEFWRKIYEVSQKFNIVNHESMLDKTKLESCQIDTLDYAVNNNMKLISEDLLLKKLTCSMNNKVVNSTNFISLVDKLCTESIDYINLIVDLSNGNYIYCINEISFLKMIMCSIVKKDIRDKIITIINNIFSTNFLFNIYIEIVMRVICYIYYYESIGDIQYFIDILNLIIKKCIEYGNTNCVEILRNMINSLYAEKKCIDLNHKIADE